MIKIRPADAAMAIGVGVETIRQGLIQGKYEFGSAVKHPGSSRYTYVIYPQAFADYVQQFRNVPYQ